MSTYICPICNVASDPKHCAMEKIAGRWCHSICIRKLAQWAIKKGARIEYFSDRPARIYMEANDGSEE